MMLDSSGTGELLDVPASGRTAIAHLRKAYTGGTHRAMRPAETLEKIAPFLPVMGITRVAMVTGLDTVGIPVAMVCRPNSRSLSVSQGKGVDIESAKVSGLMESIETYHAERIPHPLKLASYEDLRYTLPVADVTLLPHFADSRFTPFTKLLWVEAEDLMSGENRWVPHELVHMDYTLPLPTGSGCFVASSNGLASGNHVPEATIHGLCELVERDATALWHLQDKAGQHGRRVRLDTIDDPLCQALIARFEESGVAVAVWDTTSDIGVPSFVARIVQVENADSGDYRPATGMGCHPAREVALSRALTEAAQSRLTFISGARDDLWREDYERFLDPATQRSWRETVCAQGAERAWQDVPTKRFQDFHDELEWLLGRLRAVGIREVLRVDLTRPEFGIPVVRMIAPGLESFEHSPRYAPGPRAAAILGGRA